MRFSVVSAIALACTALAGCTSSSGIDGLMPQPSAELTSSVVRPSAPVIETARAPQSMPAAPQEEVLAWAGPVPDAGPFKTEPPAPLTQRPEQRVAAPISVPKPEVAAYPPVRLAPQQRSRVYSQRFRDAKPINFGSVSPRRHAVHGVDVSRWQGNIDWATLRKNGANFAYIKATDGGDHLDPMFRKNWRDAKAAGLKRGAYHFFYWCRVASQQADWFIRNVPVDPDALPPVIDVEWNGDSSCKRRPSPAQVREKMQVFMDALERHYGKRPVIYTAPDFYDDNLKGAFTDYPFWLRAVAQHPSKVYPGRRWVFWQYSGSGLSQGVNGKIDLNVFHGSEEQWHKWVDRFASQS
ncbi:glycosyl hydrolase [Brucella pituitosa]|uniref:glycoside hydrolase family 25 protein n=1 Tax=Brucella pituitosa TaxID=571256 RepID=UPI000C278779|nr:GH25 family lysozyme [Brucella pituitosa]MCK4205675.1 glycosyl hydrolase [Brucella pituitosa]PJO48730.1 glycosyl hydrolase [Brucella pituitosa]PRA86423.1 glycosyl hydrolase [Ochrobactrum sp. MYb29]